MTTLIPSHFMRDPRYGMLSTLSLAESGYPLGSVTPYINNDEGDIAIFISHLAEHTHNIQANLKVSLTIFDPNDPSNPTAGPRITCLAVAKIAEDEVPLREDYLCQFSSAEMILTLPGFHFYLLKLLKIHLIAGFGEVKWLMPEQLCL
jgi:putative heme iron utilization protein